MAEQQHVEIWLQPWCDGCERYSYECGESREWCQDNVFDPCSECGRKPVRYVIAPAPPLSPEKTGGA